MSKYILVVIFVFFAQVCPAETLTFAFSDFPPFEYTEKGRPKGINMEILEQACRRLNVSPQFVELPWKRALLHARLGRVHGVFSLFKNKERLKYYCYPGEHINSVKMILITNRERQLNIHTLEDLRGKETGVFLGSSYGAAFDAASWIKTQSAPTNASLLMRQAAGRTDVTVIDERVAQYWSRKIGMQDRFRTLGFVVTENPTYIAFSKARAGEKWAPCFSQVFKQMKKEGFMEKVNQKYRF